MPFALAGAAITLVLITYGASWHRGWARLHDAGVHWANPSESALIATGDPSLLANIAPSSLAGLLGATNVASYSTVSVTAVVVALMPEFLTCWRTPCSAG